MTAASSLRAAWGARRAVLLAALGAGLVAFLVAAIWWPPLHDKVQPLWTTAVAALKRDEPAASDGDEHAEDEHAGHDHAGHDHGDHAHAEEDLSSIELSPQAQKNIGLKTAPVAVRDFPRTISVPAVVAERPGRSQINVSAPLTGIVTAIKPLEGGAVEPGQLLFEIRMTHEDLIQAQADFLRTLEELDIVNREVIRVEKVAASGVIPKKTLLERKYEQQKLEANLHSQRQTLVLHGLSEADVDQIAASHELVRGMSVFAPGEPATNGGGTAQRLLQVQSLNVEQGQHVDAGDALCVLADYAELYIEGKAFEHDAEAIYKAASDKEAVTAMLEGRRSEPIQGLQIVYVGDEMELESRTLHFYVRLPNELISDTQTPHGQRFIGWRYKPGQRMQLQVTVETLKKRIVLPVEGVAQEGAESYVFQKVGGRFKRREVHVEYRDQSWAVIANDGSLFPADVVAITAADQLQIALKNKASGPIDPHAGHNH